MNVRRKVVCILLLCLTAAVAFAALMHHSEITIPLPAPGEAKALRGLEYRARFVASIDSVTLQTKSEASADPVVTDWVFTGSNTDGQAHRVEIVVRLLNESGEQVGFFSTKRVLPPAARALEIPLTTKVRPDAWSSAKRARIFADWMS